MRGRARSRPPAAGRRGAVAGVHDVTAGTRAAEELAAATTALRGELAQRRATEAELRAARDDVADQRAFLSQVLDAIEVAVVTCDAAGTIVHANRAAERATGGALRGRGAAGVAAEVALRRPDGTPVAEADLPLAQALRGRAVDGVEAVVTPADGSRQAIVMQALPLRDRDGSITGAVVSAYAITALREREAQLRAFAGVVAHDLKSPLTVMHGFAEMAREGLAEHAGLDDEAEMLDRVVATAERAQRLIDDLLVYAGARDGGLALADVDLRATVEDVIAERLAATPPGDDRPAPQIHVGALPRVHADPALTRQLVDNLIGNALKFTPPGRAPRIAVTGAPDAPGWVRVEVADRGIGIPAGRHAAIFKGFERAHGAAGYAGTGLGLAICRRVVARHGGRIAAEDNPGGGARIAFTLPAADAASRPAEALARSASPARG